MQTGYYRIMILPGDTTACPEANLSGHTEDTGNNLPGETVNTLTLNIFHQLIKVVPKCLYQHTPNSKMASILYSFVYLQISPCCLV